MGDVSNVPPCLTQMRSLVPLVLLCTLFGCTSHGFHDINEEHSALLYDQVRAARFAAGLTEGQFLAEIELLNSGWWQIEMRRRGVVFATPEHPGRAPPPWPSLWPPQHLLTRAELIKEGKSEQDALRSVALADRHWYGFWETTVATFPALAMGCAPIRDFPPEPPAPKGPTPRY